MSTAAQRRHLAQFIRRVPEKVTAEQARRLAALDAMQAKMVEEAKCQRS